MNLERVDQIAKAVLYEGYMLYPYRPSSVKNRQRWNFGVVYPKAFSDANGGGEPCTMRTECLITGDNGTALECKLRFLHLQTRSTDATAETRAGALPDGWQEAVERDVAVPRGMLGDLCRESVSHAFSFPSELRFDAEPGGNEAIVRRQAAVDGSIQISVEHVRGGVFRVSLLVSNGTVLESSVSFRDGALMQSLVSAHLILGAEGGEFVSLLEPAEEFQELVSQCQNVGAWPVLVGEPGQRDTLLASPIILYDYPQIAPESAGDLFDGTEIDEILSLRILTLTDEEKREIRESDERARQILERTETMPVEQFMKLHGAVRGMRPLKEDAS
jgi:hydrogenase maturation protease